MSEVMRAWPPRLPTLQRPQVAPASMAHCLLLAALLHVWLVLVLGNAPGGTAAPGQGVWGAINVRLQLRAPVSDAPQMAPQPKPEAGGAPGQAVAERWGGAVRPQGPVPEAEPGAAKLGTWGPAPTANPADSAALTAAPSISAGALPALPPLSSTAVAVAAAPAPPAPPAPPSERQLASPLARPAPAITPAPALASPALTQALPLAEPVATPPLQEAPLRALRPAPAARTPAGEQAAALAKPIDEPAAKPLPDIAAPQAMPAPRPPEPAPVLRAMEAATLPPAAVPAGPQVLQPAALETAPTTTLPSVPGPATAAAPRMAAAPDAGSREGHDVATPASNAASAVPRLNLELSRPRGGELSRGSARGVLPLLPRPPEVDDKLARDIEKAAKIDCRKAYANAGLLAVVPLAADALGKSGGCKW